jgi:hypothetical protein
MAARRATRPSERHDPERDKAPGQRLANAARSRLWLEEDARPAGDNGHDETDDGPSR